MPNLANTRVSVGRRDRKVTIRAISDDVGESGEPVEDPVELYSPFASMEAVDAPERFTEGLAMEQVTARAWAKWVVPYRADMDPFLVDIPKKRQLVYRGRVYDIAAAKLTERNDQIELLTLTKVG